MTQKCPNRVARRLYLSAQEMWDVSSPNPGAHYSSSLVWSCSLAGATWIIAALCTIFVQPDISKGKGWGSLTQSGLGSYPPTCLLCRPHNPSWAMKSMLCGKRDANKINIDHRWYGLFWFRQGGGEVSVSFERAQNKRFASSGDAGWLSQALDSAVTFSAEAKNTSSDNMWVTVSTSKGEENGNAVGGWVWGAGGEGGLYLPHTQSLPCTRTFRALSGCTGSNSHYCCFVFFFLCHKQGLVSLSKKKNSSEGRRQGVKDSQRFFPADLDHPEAWAILGLLPLLSFGAPRNHRRILFFLFFINLDKSNDVPTLDGCV